MRAPPNKRHFFKFIRPGFQDKVSIPKSFAKHLDGEKCQHALLRRGNEKWPVKITDEWVFGEGWAKFLKENGVEVCDFVVFRHEGNMVFEIMVFDSSTCERDYPQVEEYCPKSKSSKEPNSIHGSKKTLKGEKNVLSQSEQKPSSKVGHHPYFEFGMTPYNIKMAELYIPLNFAKANGLRNRNCEMILRDDQKRLWIANLRQKQTAVCLRGWQNLQIANGLKEGDIYRIELIEQGEKPIMNFHYLENKPIKAHVKAKIAMSTLNNHPCFVSTLKPYNFNKSLLYLPKKFSSSNGLRDGEMILKNEYKESWTVELRDIGKYVYIATGWSDFRIANDLKDGDFFKFELIENGKKPIANFYCMKNLAKVETEAMPAK